MPTSNGCPYISSHWSHHEAKEETETCRMNQSSSLLIFHVSPPKKKQPQNKSMQLFLAQLQRVVESVGQPSLHLLYRMVLPLGASSVFHHRAVCSGLSHQLMRSRRVRQDVIAGSECGRNSLRGTRMQARLRRIRLGVARSGGSD